MQAAGLLTFKKLKYFIIFHNQELDHLFEQKDLGVIFDADLKLDEHISAKIRKVNTMVGLIWRRLSYLKVLFSPRL